MATTKKPSPARPQQSVPAVERLMTELDHPMKDGIEFLRGLIRGMDSSIVEEVKWNAPSYRLADHFATFKLRPPTCIQLVLHTGAKVKAKPTKFVVSDPEGLLSWRAPDRAVLTLKTASDAKLKASAVKNIISQWIGQL